MPSLDQISEPELLAELYCRAGTFERLRQAVACAAGCVAQISW
jgi:hypothetical protein